MSPTDPGPRTARTTRADRIRREGVRLVVLVLLIAGAFLATRAAADELRAANVREAVEWHARGQRALASGQGQAAIEAFRHATRRDRSNRTYAVALADALARDGQLRPAEQILLTLREGAPENPSINLQLARLAARRDDAPTAIRYFRNALYAPWPDADGPRRVRLELIHLLLDRGDRDRATAELLAARANTPDTAAAHKELGTLLERAGEERYALEEYRRAVALDPGDDSARIAAGEAAFASGDYRAATQYLSVATRLDPQAAETRDVAALVVARDPLAARLGAAVRRRRLLDAIEYVRQRVAGCLPDRADVTMPDVPDHLDQDAIEDGLTAIASAEQAVGARCAATPLDRALLIIARRHETDPS